MDDIAKYNQERWTALVEGGIEWGKPHADITAEQARESLNRWGIFDQIGLSDLTGKEVLCLAGGGGQDSVKFSLLGANVSVIDLTPAQLDRDRAMAARYGFDMRIEQGDMRDLSVFADASFDIIFQPYSINFIPDPLPVFAEAARVLRPGGHYYVQFANPLWNMEETDWVESKGYPIKQPYEQGVPSTTEDLPWDVPQDDGTVLKIQGPKEFTHTMGTIVNGLGKNGLYIFAMVEGPWGDPEAEPGTFEHLQTYLPIWPAVWTRKIVTDSSGL